MGLTLNRGARRWLQYRNPRRTSGVEGNAKTVKGTSVAVAPGLGVAPEEELMILAGMSLLKEAYPQVELTYLTPTAEMPALLKSAWFLKGITQIDPDEEPIAASNAFLVTLDAPDPMEAYGAEEQDYKRWFAAEQAEKEQQQRAYDILGVKDIKIQMPVYHYEPRWSKSNAFAWKLSNSLGLPLKVPDRPIRPFGTLPSALMKANHRKLEGIQLANDRRMGTAPFLIYDFRSEPAAMALVGSVMKTFPDYQVVSLQQIEKEMGDSLTTLLSLCSHPHCEYAVCPVGPFSIAAWATGVPNVFQLYQGANSIWDGTHARNEYILDRDKFSDQELPRALEQALFLLRSRLDLL